MAIHEMFSYICVKNAGKAIEFYQAAFGATEKFRLTEPSGRIGHAELLFGKDTLMLADEFPEMGFLAPARRQPAHVRHPPARRQCRRDHRERGQGRRQAGAPSARPVLRRALRHRARPVRLRLDARPLDRGGRAGGDAAAIRCADEAQHLIVRAPAAPTALSRGLNRSLMAEHVFSPEGEDAGSDHDHGAGHDVPGQRLAVEQDAEQ